MEENFRAMLKEQREQFEKEMTALRNLVVDLHKQRNQSEGSSSHGPETSPRNGESYQILMRFSRLDFPKFNGRSLRGWLYKSEQLFEVDETPELMKVKIAAMEDKALQWHQIYMRSRLTNTVPT